MLAGRKPYDGDSPIQVAYRHVHDDVPAPSAVVAGLPAEIDALVLRATSRDPERRPADANRFLAELVRARDGLSDAELDGEGLADPQGDDGADHTVVVPLAGAAASAGRSDTQVIAAPRPDPPSPAPREAAGPAPRRRRRGLVALVLVLLVAAVLSVGAWWVGAGPGAYTTAPAVIGLTSAQADAKLAKAGLHANYADPRFSETVGKGLVLSADPKANARIRKNGTVTLILSAGKERYAAPDLSGLSEDAAREAITRAHLTVGDVRHAYDESVPKGKVVSQSPDPKALLKRDTAVSFVVSKGLPPVKVPDVRSLSLADARAALDKVGLKSRVGDQQFSDTVPKDAVISQDPSSGTLLRGSTVTLVVSKGPDMVDVPDVVGKKLDEAKKILAKAGLKVSVVRAPFGPGQVFDQSPGGGKVKRGSTVTLYVV
jgi:serine/threonine-protein kinase